MKLILCDNCGDIFNLTLRRKTCSCGKGFGKYLSDGVSAEISKDSIPIGFTNSSIRAALAKRIFLTPDTEAEFVAFVIPSNSPSIKIFDNESDYDKWLENLKPEDRQHYDIFGELRDPRGEE